jgi:adenine-specific DNA methylase
LCRYSDHWNNGKYHRAIDSYISIKRDKHCRNNCHSIYWHHGHHCHSDYRSSRKYHRAIHSYISINGDKHFRNNSHCNYWHHGHKLVVPVVSVAVVSALLVTVD